jgi:hypothetical protein
VARSHDFGPVFDALKAILEHYADRLVVVTDEPGHYYLNTRNIDARKRPIFFGAARIMKNYVSFHLMPVYGCPTLLESISPELKARMQGKACFNFKTPDEALFRELAELTERGYGAFGRGGWLGDGK